MVSWPCPWPLEDADVSTAYLKGQKVRAWLEQPCNQSQRGLHGGKCALRVTMCMCLWLSDSGQESYPQFCCHWWDYQKTIKAHEPEKVSKDKEGRMGRLEDKDHLTSPSGERALRNPQICSTLVDIWVCLKSPCFALLISLQWSAMLFVSIYVFLYFKFLFVFVFIIIFFMSLGGKEPFDISVLALSSFPSHMEQNSKLYSASLNSQQQMPNPGPRTAPFLGLTWKGERLNICICGYKKGRKVHLRWWAFCDAYNVSILW